MRFVKSVRCERLNEFPDLVCLCGRELAVFDESLEEFFLLNFHFLRNLLTHSLAQGICFKPGVAAKRNSCEEHVVLIHQESVGGIQVILHAFIEITDEAWVTLALNVLRNCFHRARAVERHHSVDVVNGSRTQFLEVARHTRAV